MSDLSDLLAKLGFRLTPEALGALLTHATKSKLSPVQILEALCDGERREREARNLARRAKLAALGSPKPLDRFDWNHPRAIERHLFESLYDSLDFVDRGENVLLRGQAGVGKTTLAQHLGLRALERGLTVRFSTLPAALADLLRQESLPATERRLRRYVTPDLLILDSCGVPRYVEWVAPRSIIRLGIGGPTPHNQDRPRGQSASSHERIEASDRQAASPGARSSRGPAFARAARFVSRFTAA